MKIIAHRGARRIIIENSLAAIKMAASLKVDGIELDVRLTKDKQLVVCHNENLRSVYGINAKLGDLTLDDLKAIKSPAGESVSTLKQVFDLKVQKPMTLDVKSAEAVELLSKFLKNNPPPMELTVQSIFAAELEALKPREDRVSLCVHTYTRPFWAINAANRIHASAVTLPLYLLNPLTYRKARNFGMEVRVYQNYLSFLLTWPWFVKSLNIFYPDLTIYTDRPDKIVLALKNHA